MRLWWPGKSEKRAEQPPAIPGADTNQTHDAPRDDAEPRRSKLASDDPVETIEEDLLDREGFAAVLADAVEDAPRESGFVIALAGPWGEGKTSVLNMAASLLERRGRIQVVRFNPWLFSGTEELVGHFFAELAAEIDHSGPAGQRVATALGAYARVIAPLKWIPGAGQVVEATRDLASGVSQVLETSRPSVRQQAQELRVALKAIERPIAILIDDIDRLHRDEVADVVRLVRLVGDFPNLTYVLAFEQGRIERALADADDPTAGSAYLEKIVQVTYDLPAIPPEAIQRLLIEAITEAVGDLEDLTFNRSAFTNIFVFGVRDLIKSLRDVRRYSNVLPAGVQLLGSEVELSDILGLEALRVFERGVWELIAAKPELMTATSDIGYSDRSKEEEQRAHVDRLLEATNRREVVRGILRELFPPIDRHFGGSHYGSQWSKTWRRERRVANQEVLDIYLARGVPAGTLPLSTVRDVLTHLDDRGALDQFLGELDADGLERLFSRLEDYEGHFETNHPEHLIGALLSSAKRLRRGRAHITDMGADIALSRAVLRVLRGLPEDEVERAVRNADIDGLYGRRQLLDLVGHRDGVGSRLVSEAFAAEMEDRLAADVLAASAEVLSGEPEVGRLLAQARHRNETDFARKIEEWTADVAFFVSLLKSAVLESVGQSLGRADVRHAYQLNWPALEKLVGRERLAERVAEHEVAIQPLVASDDILARIWRQARGYVDDPDAARRDLERWGTSTDDEEDAQ